MSEQLLLFETPTPPRKPIYNLFLAVLPDDHTAQQIIDLRSGLCRTHGVFGSLRPITCLHVSLISFGGFLNVPEAMVEVVGHICKAVTVATRPFEIEFDQVISFKGRTGNRPLVLADDDRRNDGVRKLYRSLRAEFSKYLSLPFSTSKLRPHVTLLYGQQELDLKLIEPVSWMVKEVVLVCSRSGASKHDRLGRWSFGGLGRMTIRAAGERRKLSTWKGMNQSHTNRSSNAIS